MTVFFVFVHFIVATATKTNQVENGQINFTFTSRLLYFWSKVNNNTGDCLPLLHVDPRVVNAASQCLDTICWDSFSKPLKPACMINTRKTGSIGNIRPHS